MGPSAEYAFLRTKDGITSFVKVVLRLRESTDTTAHAPVEAEAGCVVNVPAGLRDQWIQAAVAGCRDAIADASSVSGPGILIEAIQGTVVDTTVDAIQCAAYLAAIRLFVPDALPPRISSDRPWRIVR